MNLSRALFLSRQWIYISIFILIIIQLFFPVGGLETDDQINKYYLIYVSTIIILGIILAIIYIKSDKYLKYLISSKIYQKIDIIIFNIFLMLLISEIVLSLFSAHTKNPFFAVSPWAEKYVEQVRPKPYQPMMDGIMNSLGYFDTEFNETKNNKTFRIIALGDSFSMSVDYPYTHYTLLESFLNNNSDNIKYEVYNMGISGTAPQHYYVVFLESLKYKPDFVILTLFVGNDFTMELDKSKNIFKISSWYTYTFLRRIILLNKKIQEDKSKDKSLIIIQNNNKIIKTFSEKDIKVISNESIMIISKNNDNKFNIKNISSEIQNHYRTHEAFIEPHKVWEKNRLKTHFYNSLEFIKKINKESKSRFLLIIAPDLIQIDEVEGRKLLKELDKNLNDYNFSAINQKILEYCNQNQILCLDLLPSLKDARKSYFTNLGGADPHWNEWGNYIAAVEEYKYLRKNILENSTIITQ